MSQLEKQIVVLFLSSLFLCQIQAVIPVAAQTQPVIATDYSFYTGDLDSNYYPVTRVNGYLKSAQWAMCYMRVQYLADMPDVVYVGRFYGPDGALVQERTGKGNPRKAGDESVWTFGTDISKVRNNTGIWRLEMFNAQWSSPLFIEYFSVGDYLVDISVTGFPLAFSPKVAIDGKEAGTIRGGERKPSALITGTHTISINAVVNATSDSRYATDSNTWVASSASSHTFLYHTEYYLSVESPQGKVNGGGWYGEGTKATFSAEPSVTAGSGVRFVFTKWSGNYAGDSPEATMFMDGPKNVTANYKIQYYLTLESQFGSPKGDGWYDKGTMANVWVDPSIVLANGTKISFVSWSGDLTSLNNTVTVAMDKPYTVKANWKVEAPPLAPALVGTQTVYLVVGAFAVIAVIAAALIMRRKSRARS